MKGLNKTLFAPLILLLIFCLGLAKDAAGQKEGLDSQKKLKQEIQVLNLISGLYFSPQQMRFLIEKAKKAQNIRENYMQNHRQYSAASTQVLERLKNELLEDKAEVSEAVARETHQTQRKLLELRADYEKEISKIVAEVKNSLSGKQLYIIAEFKPCLVPPKGPARFGQANDFSGGVKHLERIRKIPDYRYSFKKYELADRILARLLLHKPKGVEIDEDQLRSKVLSVFDEARGLAEIDFNLQKEELAKKLKEQTAPKKEKEVNVDIRIERFILNPAVISVLEDKLGKTPS